MTEGQEILKAGYYTLGCKLNFAETSAIRKTLESKGIVKTSAGEIPDLCIVNTCSVTSMADKKAKHLIRNLAGKFPEAAIIVTGCYAQLRPEEAATLPGVVMVLGSQEKQRLPEFLDRWLENREKKIVETTATKNIKEFHATCERGDRTRFFLKVQDGCNYYCTYCTIPYARGNSRSGKISEMTALAREAAEAGGKEIVLTGVNVGEFGRDHTETFFDLIKALDKTEGIERFRISSIEPNLLTEDIIRWVALESKRFMPHFHIPLQSGSDKVLGLMKRRYDTSLFASRIKFIREMIPDAFIGVDIIAGARGETPEEWEKSLEFVNSLDITKLHVFPYSERAGTRALSLDESVDQAEKHRRAAILSRISEKKTKEFLKGEKGKIRPVLWETFHDDRMQGLTDNYIRIEAPFIEGMLNTISLVEIGDEVEEDSVILRGRHLPIQADGFIHRKEV